VTILVDEARWEWRGARWAHLVSDESHDELHAFALRLGMRRLGFQGDHYDIDDVDRTRALALGASAVGSRELVRCLRAAGLRDRTSKPQWARVGSWPGGHQPTVEPLFAARLAGVDVDLAAATVASFEDDTHRVLLIDVPPGLTLAVDPDVAVIVGAPRADGWRSIEIFVSR
jgi:hypothetical protein